jgi:O-acetyl-ADP-ribose deacetylase (regulator of RNase III)
MDAQTYQVGRSSITLIFGDITTSRAEAIVSSDDCYLSMGGGVSAAICDAAGPDYCQQAHKVSRPRPGTRRIPSPGDVVVTPAGDLPAKYVFHAVTRARQPAALSHDAIVRQACRRIMHLLPLLNCRHVAFPSIGTGYVGIEAAVAAEQMAAVLTRALLETDEAYRVELYLLDRTLNPGTAQAFFTSFEEFLHRTLALAVLESDDGRELAPPAEPANACDREATRRFDVYTMLRRLDARRDELDALIHAALDDLDPDNGDQIKRLQEQLKAVAGLRRVYEAELVLPPQHTSFEPGTVFLSSTWEDLKEHRGRARAAVERLGLRFIGMEDFPACGTAPADYIRQEVNRAEVYVGVLGMRYGYVDPALGFSMTELEYRQAVASRKPRHLFVMSSQA